MAGKRTRDLRGIAITSLLVLTLTQPLSGCTSGGNVGSQGVTSAPTVESVDYINDHLGFAAKFPSTPSETVEEQEIDGATYTSLFVYGEAGMEQTTIVVQYLEPPSEADRARLAGIPDKDEKEALAGILALFHRVITGGEHTDPPIEFATRDGDPSATTIFSDTDAGQTMWFYDTVIFRADGRVYECRGSRWTEEGAVTAEASFRLIEADDAAANARSSASANQGFTYSDPRWPTTHPELLAIPEADRWYNSRERVGSHGTIAGPVASVAYLDNRVMVNIGADYPDPGRAQVVIWAEQVSDFQDILNDIDHGGAWVAVSGQIRAYDGVAEIDVGDGPTDWRWWQESR